MTAADKKRTYLTRGLEIARKLYDATGSERHQNYINDFERKLQSLRQTE